MKLIKKFSVVIYDKREVATVLKHHALKVFWEREGKGPCTPFPALDGRVW
jgi:hypothetical protein